jgi:hypothetical protein
MRHQRYFVLLAVIVEMLVLFLPGGSISSGSGMVSSIRTAYIRTVMPDSGMVSISGAPLSASDVDKDIVVYDGPSYNGYRKNVFTGCIHAVTDARRLQLGFWSGERCVAASYPGPAVTTSTRPIIYGTDDTAALQSEVNALRAGRRLIIRETLLIRDTIVFKNKTGGEFGGVGAGGQVVSPPFAGSNIVWAGPARKPMFKFQNSGGMFVHDLHFVGNSNPRNRPSAFIDIAQTIRVAIPNQFAGISNIVGGALDNPAGGIWDNVDNGIYLARSGLYRCGTQIYQYTSL